MTATIYSFKEYKRGDVFTDKLSKDITIQYKVIGKSGDRKYEVIMTRVEDETVTHS